VSTSGVNTINVTRNDELALLVERWELHYAPATCSEIEKDWRAVLVAIGPAFWPLGVSLIAVGLASQAKTSVRSCGSRLEEQIS
jgi:hypothetical protein